MSTTYPVTTTSADDIAAERVSACLDTISILSRAHADLNGSLTEAGENARKGIEAIVERYVAALTPDQEEALSETA